MSFRVLHSLEAWTRHCAAARGKARRTVLSVGNFDGLHLGHQRILRGIVARAREFEATALAVTFDPHPLKVLYPTQAPPLIATLRQRLTDLRRMGLDAALVLRFDRKLARLSPEEFVRGILVERLGVQRILVGADFRFGYRQTGDVKLLERIGGQCGFDVEIVPPVVVRGHVVSSTLIRRAIAGGNVEHAARALGGPFTLTGRIQRGTGVGRRLVFPTLNLKYDQELIPKRGVYVTESVVRGRRYPSVTNVGFRPTFDATTLTVESYLLRSSGRVSSGAMQLRFLKRLREEKKFPSPHALRRQVQRDIARARAFFLRRNLQPPKDSARHSLPPRARSGAACRTQ